MIGLPRQARDKRQECVFMQVAFAFKHEIASNTPDIAYLTTLDRFGKENATLSEPFIYINDRFTKTGSGQTQENA
jgi:hypothetical protein